MGIWHFSRRRLGRWLNFGGSAHQSHVREPLAPDVALLPQFLAHWTPSGKPRSRGRPGRAPVGEEDVVDVLEKVPDGLRGLLLQLVVRPRERGLRPPLVETRPGEARPASRTGRDERAPPEISICTYVFQARFYGRVFSNPSR